MQSASLAWLLAVVLTATVGCATAGVRVAHEAPDTLPKFERVAIPPFENRVGDALPSTAPENVAGALIAGLQRERATAFREVSSRASGQPGELLVRGAIIKYNPGSKALRFILIGLGAGRLELDVRLVDSATDQTIEQFSTSGSVMAGGYAGATMGIGDMIDAAVKKVAERVAKYGSGG